MKRTALLITFLVAFALAGSSMGPQEKPFERAFIAGDVHRYRVELVVRTELEGQRAVQVGVKEYSEPFVRFAEARVSWVATRRVVSVDAEGTAEFEESLDGFSAPEFRAATEGDAEWKKVQDALATAFQRWAAPRTLRYREARTGQLLGLAPEGALVLDESAPPLLTLWLLRALRPAAVLPARRLRAGEAWQEPRAVDLPNWSDVTAAESGEWLDAPGSAEPALRLHMVQQISGKLAPNRGDAPAAATEGRFHGESLATISLMDGRVLSATRSGSRETVWTLAANDASPLSARDKQEQPPRFRGRLSVQVQMDECSDNCR